MDYETREQIDAAIEACCQGPLSEPDAQVLYEIGDKIRAVRGIG